MDRERNRTSSHGGANRVSLACVPCRTRHVRCDASRPACSRCRANGKQCCYAESRRGGLTRSALAARRNVAAISGLERASDSTFPYPGECEREEQRRHLPRALVASNMSQVSRVTPFLDSARAVESGTLDNLWPADLLDISRDPCIDLYYKHFHLFHPCVLPRQCLEKQLQDTAKHPSLRPLVAVMRYVGSLYCQSDQADRLRGDVSSICMKAGQDLRDPFIVQYHLINSIAQYWCGEAVQSREEMDRAISLALDLKMHCQEFAITYGQGDPVLRESWRRTWWQIYVVDAYYAAMKNTTTYPTYDVDVTTELPCEEYEYESGVRISPGSFHLDFVCHT